MTLPLHAIPGRRKRLPPLRVGVGGPVGSGKTTLVEMLCTTLRESWELLVVTNLQLSLLVAVLFAMIEPGGSPAWLQGGVLLMLVHFATATWVCTNLLRERCTRRTFDRLLRASTFLVLLPATAMLGRGLWQTELLGMHFLRLEGQPGLYPPWHLLVEAIYFVGRSLVTMLAAQDLLLRSRGSVT